MRKDGKGSSTVIFNSALVMRELYPSNIMLDSPVNITVVTAGLPLMTQSYTRSITCL